jgi:tetratricopeptide (TPR) repeat protein
MTTSRYRLTKLSALLITCALAGCSMFPGKSARNWNEPAVSDDVALTRSQTLLRTGADYLQSGELDKAQKVFNSGLKFDIKSAPMHFFNALTYQLKYEKGDADSFALAEVGYRTAINLDSTLDIAHLQLGRLYMGAKNYGAAKKAFALAVDAKPKAPQEALYALAQASLLSGDSDTSVWAAAQLDDLHWPDARLYRIKAFHAALAKQPKVAADMLAQYAALEVNKQESRYVGSRVDQLLAMKTAYTKGKSNDVILLADASPEPAKSDSKDAADDKKADAAPSEQRKNWFRCDSRPGPVLEKDAISINPALALPASEENFTAPTLPAPCDGETPPVAMIEVTMIRTEETVQKSYGVNLLDGLSMAKTLSNGIDGSVTQGATNIFNMADGLGSGFLQYSLNIANSLYTKNEVIARPTLAAIDRLPSVFFSGATYSIKIAGANSATLVDKAVGIALAVTPTFLPDDQVMLSIRASRSFLEDSPNPDVSLTQTRNAVNGTALVKYGQTFILNGLVEREKDLVSSGVPVLEDIPVLQYFFKKSVNLDYNRQILTLVTVRRLVDSDESVALAKNKDGLISAHKLSSQVQEFMDLQNNVPALDEVITGLRSDNSLYTKLRQRDMIQESYGSKNLLKKIIFDMMDMSYF